MTTKETKEMTALAQDFTKANLNARPNDELSPEEAQALLEKAAKIEGLHIT